MMVPQEAVKVAVEFINSFQDVQKWDIPWLEEISQTESQWVITLGLTPFPIGFSDKMNPRRAKEFKVFRINKYNGQITAMEIKQINK